MTKKKKIPKEELLVKLFVQRVSSATTFAKRFKKICHLLDSRPKLSDDQWIRVWRGLYYSVWYTEMDKGGEELIQRVGGHDDRQMLLTGFQALTNDWFGIDVFRLDKYMLLGRVMTNSCLKLQVQELLNSCSVGSNNSDEIDNESSEEQNETKKSAIKTTKNEKKEKIILFPIQIRAKIMDQILSTMKASIGLSLHITDLFIDELVKVFDEFRPRLKSVQKIDLFSDILIPFVKLMATTEDHRVLTNIKQKIFDKFKNEVLIGESIAARKEILQKLIDAMITIGGVEAIGRRNRDSIYDLGQNYRTKLNQLSDTNEVKSLKRKKILIGRGRHKRVKYEVTASSPFVTSIVPIAVV